MLVGQTGQCPWKSFVVPHQGGQDPSKETTNLTTLSFQSVAGPVLFRTLPWGYVPRLMGPVLHASSELNLMMAKLLENLLPLVTLMSFSCHTRTGWLVFPCKPNIQRLRGQADRLLLIICQSVGLVFICNQNFQGARVTPYCSSASPVDCCFSVPMKSDSS